MSKVTKFNLEIELGNDAMRTPCDVAEALSKLARDLQYEMGELGRVFLNGPIFDRNGNKVGAYNTRTVK